MSDSLFKDSSILIVATLFSGGLNYLFQVVMGRLLGPEQYGVFGSLFALSYVLLIVSAGIGYVATKYVSVLKGEELSGFMRRIGFRVVILTVFMYVILVAVTPFLTSFLNLSNPLLVYVLGLTILLGPLSSFLNGSLRGLQHFFLFGGAKIGNASLKLIFGTIFVVIGFGVYGAIGALVLTQVLIVGGIAFYLRSYWYGVYGEFKDFSNVYRYALPSILVSFCFNVPTNVDVMIVKSLFTSTETGLYTAITVFGKVLVFLPMGISSSLFPKVSERHSNGTNTSSLLRRALFYTSIVVGSVVLVYGVISKTLVTLLFGESYTVAAGLLPWYGTMVSLFSLNVVMLNYSLATDDLRYVKVVSTLTAAEIAVIYLFSTTMVQVIQMMLIFNGIGLIVGLGLFFAPNCVFGQPAVGEEENDGG